MAGTSTSALLLASAVRRSNSVSTAHAELCKNVLLSWSRHGERPRGYHHGNLKEALIRAALELIAQKGPAGFTLRKPPAGQE
jgi:hypothetical protein